MNYFYTLLFLVLFFTSCKENKVYNNEKAKRTVIIYMSAENNLNHIAIDDINEMVEGSKKMPANTNFIAFVDLADKTNPPYVLRFENGKSQIDTDITFNEDFYASDPNMMHDVLSRIILKYPAESFGLVLWGHANGWFVDDNSIDFNNKGKHRAYGGDTGNNTNYNAGKYWMNIPDMAKCLERLPIKFDYIFADCCNFQCVEVAYELRNTVDYIIGSPAEIPGNGAPYDKLLPCLLNTKELYYKDIVDVYYNHYYQKESGNYPNLDIAVPLSVISTKNISALASATRNISQELFSAEINIDNVIYYYKNWPCKVMFDAKSLILNNFSINNGIDSWLNALERTVVYKKRCSSWDTIFSISFTDFNVTDENYSGVSMFFPLEEYDTKFMDYNKNISQLQWFYDSGMNEYYIKNNNL